MHSSRQIQQNQSPGNEKKAWKLKFPAKKIRVFIYTLLQKQNRTPTKECLQKIGLKSALCSICNSEIESQNQLFIRCPLAKTLGLWLRKPRIGLMTDPFQIMSGLLTGLTTRLFPLFTPFFSGLFGWQERILSSIEHQTIGHFCLSLQTPLIGQVKLFVQASAKE